MKTTRLKVSGMTCGHCVRAVEQALQGRAGVSSVRVDLKGGVAEVQYDAAAVAPEQLVAAVEAEGYQAEIAG